MLFFFHGLQLSRGLKFLSNILNIYSLIINIIYRERIDITYKKEYIGLITRYLPDLENSSVSFLEDFLFVIKFFGPVVAFMRVHFNIYFNINDATTKCLA